MCLWKTNYTSSNISKNKYIIKITSSTGKYLCIRKFIRMIFTKAKECISNILTNWWHIHRIKYYWVTIKIRPGCSLTLYRPGALVLKMWAVDHLCQHQLETWWKWRVLGPILELLNQNLHFNLLHRLFLCTLKIEKSCPRRYMLVTFTVTHPCFADYGTKAQRYLARETEVGLCSITI